jgi:hypothetical protein
MASIWQQEHGCEQGDLHEHQDPPDDAIVAGILVSGGQHEQRAYRCLHDRLLCA